MELLSKYVEFKNGKKRPNNKGSIPVYGGNGILDYTDVSNMKSGVVIGRVGAYCGSVFLVNDECWVSDNAIKATCRDNMDLKYLYYLLSSLHLNERRIGTSQPLLTQSILNNIEVNIPVLHVQKKISSILETLDRKIKINKEINNNLEQQAQTIYKSWFIDYEPFGGVLPEDWNNGTIVDLAQDVICGKTPSTKQSEYYGGSTPFITIPDMHGCVYNVKTERYLSRKGVASQPKKTLPPNSICVSCIGTAGLVSLVSEESQTNQQINSIIPKKDISAYYIYLLMQTQAEVIIKLGQSGSTIVNLNKTQFGKIPVIIPSKKVLYKFDTICKPLFEMILSNQKENIELANLRDSLLPKLMSGEVDVSNIDL